MSRNPISAEGQADEERCSFRRLPSPYAGDSGLTAIRGVGIGQHLRERHYGDCCDAMRCGRDYVLIEKNAGNFSKATARVAAYKEKRASDAR